MNVFAKRAVESAPDPMKGVKRLTAESIDDYSEVMATLRHYSNLRFALFTLFSGGTAGLTAAQFGTSVVAPMVLPVSMIPVAGLLLTVCAFWFELTIDSYMLAFTRIAKRLRPAGHWSRRPKWPAIVVRVPVWALYLAVIGFWIAALRMGWQPKI